MSSGNSSTPSFWTIFFSNRKAGRKKIDPESRFLSYFPHLKSRDYERFSLPLAGRFREGGERLGIRFQILKQRSKPHSPTPVPSREGRGNSLSSRILFTCVKQERNLFPKIIRIVLVSLSVLTLAACAEKASNERITLTPVGFDDLPGWSDDHAAEVAPVLATYCPTLVKRSQDWRGFCEQLTSLPTQNDAAARHLFEAYLQPMSVAGAEGDTGLFTGYYQAELRGSRQRHGRYQTPLYMRPQDLVGVDLGAFKPEWNGKHIAGKVQNGKLVPYDDRAAIENGHLAGRAKVLLWVDDPIDAFILAVQGSGRVRMTDGHDVYVGYDGANGRAYVSIGKILADSGAIERPVTMPKIRAWLTTHPNRARQIMDSNPSYVFFKSMPTTAAIGAAGHPLTPLRSLAVDPAFVPYGTLLWLDTTTGSGAPLQRLMVAEDTGGAIKGAVRGDIFWGSGLEAENQAGSMQSSGKYYIFAPKSSNKQPLEPAHFN